MSEITNRELLELAAKNAKFDLTNFNWCEYSEPTEWAKARNIFYAWGFIENQTASKSVMWNPLVDDGDALRLAVKLNMSVVQHQHGCGWVDVAGVKELIGDNPYSATRKAIVRAAAKRGVV